jgi:hypothetical protein
MITISKTMLALSALMSAGLVAALALPSTATENQTPNMQVSQRFPVADEMFAPVPLTQFAAQKFIEQKQIADGSKGDRLAGSDACDRAGWPYFAYDCLVSADGVPVRKVSRVITIERRVGDNTSELVRTPVADVAQR